MSEEKIEAGMDTLVMGKLLHEIIIAFSEGRLNGEERDKVNIAVE